jgi:hypothetical protein
VFGILKGKDRTRATGFAPASGPSAEPAGFQTIAAFDEDCKCAGDDYQILEACNTRML